MANALVGAAHVPAFVLLSIMLQEVMGYPAIAAGFAVLPVAVVNMVVARTALPWAVRRFGHGGTFAVGMGLLSVGLVGFAVLPHPDAAYLTAVLPACVVFAAGLPAVFLGATASAVRAAPEQHSGAASGLLNTAQRLGSAIGVTALVLAASEWTAAHGGTSDALADGLRLGFAGAAALAILGVVCGLAMFTRRPAMSEGSAR